MSVEYRIVYTTVKMCLLIELVLPFVLKALPSLR
jgi:hypothetical protein